MQDSVQETNEKVQGLIDHLPFVVFEYTFFPEGYRDFTYISPRCEELLGLQPAKCGRTFRDGYTTPYEKGARLCRTPAALWGFQTGSKNK